MAVPVTPSATPRAGVSADPPGLVVAAFDFDGTLTRGDSLLPFLRLALGWPKLLWALFVSSPWLAAFALGLMGNQRAKARLLMVCLRGRGVSELERLAQDFAVRELDGEWHSEALATLRQHQQAGHLCVIVSASPDIYLRAAAQQLGVAHLICTEMQIAGAVLTGEMGTPNCHGEQKAARLKAWIKTQAATRVNADVAPAILYAYGDSDGDAAMLHLANYAFYRGKPLADKPATQPTGERHAPPRSH